MKKLLLLSTFISFAHCYAIDYRLSSNDTTMLILDNSGDEGMILPGGALDVNGTCIVMGNNGTGSDQKLINMGTISTSAFSATGINNNQGVDVAIINSGTLAILGASGIGIYNFKTTATAITNSGLLSTTNSAAFAIYSFEDTDSMITNSGTISTLAVSSLAINCNHSINATVINSGMVSTAAPLAWALCLQNAQNTLIINSGTIKGQISRGIYDRDSTNTQIINSGIIIGSEYAINSSNPITTGPTLTLLQGSNIQGAIHADTLPLNLHVQPGINLALSLDDTSLPYGALNIKDPYVVTADPVVAVIDPTGFMVQADVTADISDAILDGIYLHRACSCGFWLQALGSYRNRNGQNDFVGYYDWQGGGILGYDRKSLSLFLGSSFVKAMTDGATQQANIVTRFAGVSYAGYFCETFLAMTAVVSAINWDNSREVMNNMAPGGIEEATFTINRCFFTADVTLARSFCFLWHPLVTCNFRYAGLFLGSYGENGSLANLSVRGRTIDLITTRLDTTLKRFCYLGFLEPYIGLFGRYQVGGNFIEGQLMGLPVSFGQPGPRNLAAFLLGVRAIQTLGAWDIFFNCEASFDSASSSRILGEGGIRF